MRPFGADSSIGVTSTTSASAQTRSASSFLPSSFGASAPRRFLSVSMPSPVCALTHRTPVGRDGIRSALLKTTRCGISFSRNSARSSVSKSSIPFVPSTTRTAMSVLFKTRFVRSTRLLPSSCSSSSKPGVSVMTTGPSGSSSIAFCTGSVVVPGRSETTARSCAVTALTRLDFPALRLPKKPM